LARGETVGDRSGAARSRAWSRFFLFWFVFLCALRTPHGARPLIRPTWARAPTGDPPPQASIGDTRGPYTPFAQGFLRSGRNRHFPCSGLPGDPPWGPGIGRSGRVLRHHRSRWGRRAVHGDRGSRYGLVLIGVGPRRLLSRGGAAHEHHSAPGFNGGVVGLFLPRFLCCFARWVHFRLGGAGYPSNFTGVFRFPWRFIGYSSWAPALGRGIFGCGAGARDVCRDQGNAK